MKSSSSSVLKLFLSSSYVAVLPPPVPPPITRCCLALAVSLRHDFHGFRASLLPSLLRDFCIASRCFKNCAAAKPRAPDHPVRYLTLYLSENFAVGTESEYTRLPNRHNKVSSAFSAISRLFARCRGFFAAFLCKLSIRNFTVRRNAFAVGPHGFMIVLKHLPNFLDFARSSVRARPYQT